MADLTPLSISLLMDRRTEKIQRDQDSYEAKVKGRNFKPGGSQKHEFGSEYRDIRATSPSALDEASEFKKLPNYPAAPSPFANKSSENTKFDTRFLRTSPTLAKAPFVKGRPMASDTKSKPQPQGHARQSFSSDAPTSTSITAEPPSSVPSSNDFTKEQIAKIVDKDGYRPSAGDSSLSDQEEDTDDEHATESDLETHAGDDEFNSATHPGEEGEGCDGLQYQFKNVRIHKRQRDDVEDAEDDNAVDAARLEGDRKQITRKLPLTDEERAHRGKKSRTARIISAADGGQDGQDVHGIEKT